MSGGAHQNALLHHLGDTCKTIEVLSEELQLSRRQISDAAIGLIRKEYLERIELGCFQLTAKGREAAAQGEQITSGPNGQWDKPRRALPNTLRQRAWNALRIQRRFTVQDIVTAATIGDEGNATNNLQRYFKILCDAGVLRCLPKRQRGVRPGSPGFAQYTLVKDLGRIAPSYSAKSRSLIDHNSGTEIVQ